MYHFGFFSFLTGLFSLRIEGICSSSSFVFVLVCLCPCLLFVLSSLGLVMSCELCLVTCVVIVLSFVLFLPCLAFVPLPFGRPIVAWAGPSLFVLFFSCVGMVALRFSSVV
jgi:hypothetical protein